MFRKSTFAIACTAATVLGAVATPVKPASAATLFNCSDLNNACNLGTLISNMGFIQQGDKIFSDFAFIPAPQSAPIKASDVSVTSFTLNPFQHGLQFTGGFFAGPNQVFDYSLFYTVKSLGSAIKDIQLAFNGKATGTGFASIEETVTKPGTIQPILGQASVDTTNIPTSLTDVAILTTPVQEARVEKDMFLMGGPNGTARFSIVDQVVTVTEVPEPGTVGGLLALGSIGIGAMLKKRRSQSDELAFLAVPNDPNNN